MDVAAGFVWGCSIRCRCIATSLSCTAQVMLGVDRLDMIKGIPQKLLAFEKFLVRRIPTP